LSTDKRSQSPRATANGYRSQSYYLSDDLHRRIKAAWWATRTQSDGAPSLSLLVSRLLETESLRLEREHNAGKRFPAAPTSARGRRSEHLSGHRSRTYYLTSDLHDRIKAAWWATQEQPSLSILVAALLEVEAGRLERAHNAGEPFPPAPASARGVDPEAARRQGQFMTNLWAGIRGGSE